MTAAGPAAARSAQEVVRVLSRHVLPARLARLRAQLACRVVDTALVLENVADAQNVHACLRTADALGLQHVHVVNRYVGTASAGAAAVPPPPPPPPGSASTSVDRGAIKWLTVRHHTDTAACLAALRADGFLIAASDLGAGAVDVAAAARWTTSRRALAGGAGGRLQRPRVAVFMGNEARGVSRLAREASDVRFFIPQAGFSQSLNVSVATALALSAFLHRTPDYASHALAAHRTRVSGAAEGAVASSAATTATAAAAATAPAAEETLPVAAAPASIGAQGEEAEAGTACELLGADEIDAILARTLLLDVPAAAAVLDRAGVRPIDY